MQNVEIKDQSPHCSKHVLPAVPSSDVYLEDCVTALKRYADNYFDLAIVDPPYGNIAVFENCQPLERKNERPKKYADKDWDKQKPTAEYWEQLFRVSKNQIVWGGNYFELPLTKSWIVWDKNNGESGFADGEMAWTSFNKPMRIKKIHWTGSASNWEDTNGKIHPTQKPLKLYKWLLKEFAVEGNLILDTHVGSGSSRIACNELHFAFTGFELDKDYYEAQEKRFKDFVSQLRMF